MYTYRAVCVRVIDGDTVELLVDLGFNIQYKIRGRLYNLDAPEIFSGDNKEAGQKAKEYLQQLVLGKIITINTYKDRMSFNRWIVEITDALGNNINEQVSTFCKTL